MKSILKLLLVDESTYVLSLKAIVKKHDPTKKWYNSRKVVLSLRRAISLTIIMLITHGIIFMYLFIFLLLHAMGYV